MPSDTELFSRLAREIWEATERFYAEELGEEALPTSAELARKFNYRLDTVKKKLRVLKEADLVHSLGMTPKRYRFNRWALKSLDPAHPLYDAVWELEEA